MNNIENFCIELKNDIFSEIGENKDWDTADYTMSFFGGAGNGSTGLIILKRDNQEVKRIRQKKSTYFWDAINLLIDRSKINKGILTIYPNGEYESSFIWDEEAHLSRLIGSVYALLSFVNEELTYRISKKFPKTIILWNETVLTISFVKGKIQPLQTKIKTKEKIIEHSILIKDITYEETPELVAQFEEMYQLTNEGELKGKLSEKKWNTLVCYNMIDPSNLEKNVKFEWREENA